MQDFEKLGSFYIGKKYDVKSKSITDDVILYDSKDLTTHAVCVGMTGSGKTGLCISLLEEAAIDSIPSIIIDPKGDITNLLLTFPNLKMEDFLPWINVSDARKKGLTEEEYAKSQARMWKKGLAGWGQDGKRIQKLKDSADFNIYTPGSSAGKQISILKSFDAPSEEIRNEPDWFADRISSTSSTILGLLGIEADPIKSREHILLSNILKHFWALGENLDITKLIQAVQSPPFEKVGVFDIESFFPNKDRFGLAMELNNLLSSPTFQSWLKGEPLEINDLLYTAQGNPKVSIFYIAHLSESERMFFTSLLLNNILEWMRMQSGTTSLRALLYIDELFGFMPPISNPPSKKPLLTIMKQARAFGLGVVLATQNPVDLDYKSLSNAGTWLIGRLQTKQDINRVIDGLEGAASSSGESLNKGEIENLISNLDKRVFLLHNVHEKEPIVFYTRWAMSYLRGPLTRTQIKKLMQPKKSAMPSVHNEHESPKVSKKILSKPSLPPEIKQLYYPSEGEAAENYLYKPYLIGIADVNFINARNKIDLAKTAQFTTPIVDDVISVDWKRAQEFDYGLDRLYKKPEKGIEFSTLPNTASQTKNYKLWEKEFRDYLYRDYYIELLKSPTLGEISKPGESAKDFRIRLRQQAREQRDEWVEKIRAKYSRKTESLQNKIRRAEAKIETEMAQSKQQKLQSVISLGATILGAFLGRKAISSSTISKAGTTIRSASRAVKETQDVVRAKENLKILQEKLADLQEKFNEEVEDYSDKFDISLEEFEKVVVRPKKTDINVNLCTLLWIPEAK